MGWVNNTLFGCACIVTSCVNSVVQSDAGGDLTYEQQTSLRLPADPVAQVYRNLAFGNDVTAFYNTRDGVPVWIDNERFSLADTLYQFLENSSAWGLDPVNYHYKELAALNADTLQSASDRMEVLMTDAFFAVVRDLQHGYFATDSMTPQHVSQFAGDSLLNEVLSTGRLTVVLESLQPAHPLYGSLLNELKTLSRKSKGKEGGDFVDSATQQKIRLLDYTINKLRREKEVFPKRYLLVNIPSYTMKVVEDDSIVLFSKVIVGAPETPTPELTSVIRKFTIYPYWTVPRSIVVKEILPAVQRNLSYLKRYRYDVLNGVGEVINPDSLPWETFTEDNFPYTIRQMEGVDNALGIIKFSFSNPYNVYLHDTNARGLFRREDRALSHGCVRVERAMDLAHYLLREDSVYYTPDDLDQYLEFRARVDIPVYNPIPVLIRYYPCDVIDGAVECFEDVYRVFDEGGVDPL